MVMVTDGGQRDEQVHIGKLLRWRELKYYQQRTSDYEPKEGESFCFGQVP